MLVQGKLLLQEAVRLKISWNDTLTPVLRQKWENWVINLKSVNKLTIPRSLIKPNSADASLELYCFTDASQQAYGFYIYIRCTSKSGHIHTALVASKVRVCHLKVQTIPRLELQSAILSARLEKSVKSAITIPLLQSTYWTDSKITLAYIQNEKRRFNVFVSNRVQMIKRFTCSDDWRHISGALNPADVLTRPVTVHHRKHTEWQQGPAFLRTHSSECDASIPVDLASVNADLEVIKQKSTALATDTSCHPLDVMINHYSD